MRCRYQLLGQPLLGACPECGLSVASSLAANMEHSQRTLADLRKPHRVAAAVVSGAVAVLASVALQMGAPMLSTIESFTGHRGSFPDRIRLWGWIGSALALLVTVTLLHAALGRGESMLRREMGRWRLWLLAGGWCWLVAVAASAAVAWRGFGLPRAVLDALPWAGVAIQLPGMAAMLSGYHALLAITGRRSRTFTEASAARQSVRLLNGTAALLVVISIAGLILQTRVVQDPDLQVLVGVTSRVAAACLAALLLFGSAYLVANAWWIARSLLLPTDRGNESPDL